MIGAIRSVLRHGFELIERPFERLFGPSLKPLSQLGALVYFFFCFLYCLAFVHSL